MLEDLLKMESAAVERERQRLAIQAVYDEKLLAFLAEYTPLLEEFCRESGWIMQHKGIDLMHHNQHSGGNPIERCLNVFLEGPLKPYYNSDYSGTMHAGINLFLWLDDGRFWRGPMLQCATYCTKLKTMDSDYYTSWSGINLNKLQLCLRVAFKLFGSRVQSNTKEAG